MERVINDIFIIPDDETVKEMIHRIVDIFPDMDEIEEQISKDESKIFYLDMDFKIAEALDESVKFAWLDTGLKVPTGSPIMLSLIHYDDYFCGSYVGTPGYLVNGACRRKPYNAETYKNNLRKFNEKYRKLNQEFYGTHTEIKPADIVAGNKNHFENHTDRISKVAAEINEKLLFPHWKSIEGLERFLKISSTRISQLIERDEDLYFVKNDLGSVIINTGMMDVFGADILILYRYHLGYKSYAPECLISSKQDYMNNGFSKEQSTVSLEPISFFNANEEIFNPNMDDFDINQNCLMHIIQERKDRFPESIQSQSDIKIANQLVNALERGVKMQRRDRSFAKASYSGKTGKISWMMPLHIDAQLNENPELVMVIVKTGAFYEVKTILPYDESIQDRITALSLYSRIWN